MGTSFEELDNPENDKDHPHAYGDKIVCRHVIKFR